MTTFDPTTHTAEALASEASRLYTDYPDTRVVGSLGRSVIFNELLGDPIYEFRSRGQDVLGVAGRARDIDIITSGPSALEDYDPFEVETTGFSNSYIKFLCEGGDWFVVSDHHSFAEPLRPEVMEPVQGKGVLGIEFITLPAQTLLATYGLKGQLRNKDIRTRGMLKQAIVDGDGQSSFPPAFLAPLTELAARNRSSLYVRAQDAYRRHIPDTIRSRAVPFMKIAKKIFLK